MGWFNNGEKAGRKADKRWDKQVEIAYEAAKDHSDYVTESQNLAYNDAVLGKTIQERNLNQQLLWQESTAMEAWDHSVEQQIAEFKSQVKAFNKSERLYGAQVGLNEYARSLADDSAEAVRNERLEALKFQGMEAELNLDKTRADISQQRLGLDLNLSQTKADIAQQRTGLNIGSSKRRSDISQQQMAATLQNQQRLSLIHI